jgi:phosphatidylethanolamine-binding protein (PEBP) family uncharacterized protein
MGSKRRTRRKQSRRRSKRQRKAQKGGGNALPLLAGLSAPQGPGPSFEATLGGVPLTTDGPIIRQDKTDNPPVLQWNPAPATLYTVIAWDPDASASPWLHWLATNLSGPADSFPALVAWAAATPPQGTHRYIVGLFKQNQDHINPRTPPQRGSFPLQAFVQENNLTLLAYRGFRVRAPPQAAA